MRRTCLCFPSFTTIRIGLICNDPAGNSYPMVELLGLAARDPPGVLGLLSIAHDHLSELPYHAAEEGIR